MSSLTPTVLDIEILPGDPKLNAFRILKEIRPEWKFENVNFHEYSNGLANRTIRCHLFSDTDRRDAIIVHYCEKADFLYQMHDHQEELAAMKLTSYVGSCRPLLAFFKNGMAYYWAPGSDLRWKDYFDPKIARSVVRSIAKLHTLDPDNLEVRKKFRAELELLDKSSFLKTVRKCLDAVPDVHDDPTESERLIRKSIPAKSILYAELDFIESFMEQLGVPRVICHNDLQLFNIVYDEKTDNVQLIDYEFAGYSYSLLDLVRALEDKTFHDLNGDAHEPLTKDVLMMWVRFYLEAVNECQGRPASDVTPADVETCYRLCEKCRIITKLCWGVVFLAYVNLGTTQPFLRGASIMLNDYFAEKELLFK